MWTIIRFAVADGDEARYRTAFEILGRCGFQPHRRPGRGVPQDPAAAWSHPPAAVVADLFQDPAVVVREVFCALVAAGVRPLLVTGAHVDVGRRGREDGAGAARPVT